MGWRVPLDVSSADFVETFADRCMQLLEAEVSPKNVRFEEESHASLFDCVYSFRERARKPLRSVLPGRSENMWRYAAHHRSSERLSVLYSLLWDRRVGAVDPFDPRVAQVRKWSAAVRRDAHKLKAFLRFNELPSADAEGGARRFVGWHRTDHRVLPLVADFFAERFSDMRFSIFTPDLSMHFDPAVGTAHFGEGAARSALPAADELEALWKVYYRSTFNPARIRLSAMRSEMPKKHWATMPETTELASMLAEAPARVAAMQELVRNLPDASRAIPPRPSLEMLRAALPQCRGCDLHERATQVVPGEGPVGAEIVLVGEAPGDCEDRQGVPFVGPAGRLLRECAREAGLDWGALFRTNAVKHFRFREQTHPRLQGKKRIHDRPRAGEIRACAPWLRAELEALKHARIVVCLGRTAAKSVLGALAPGSIQRGEITECAWADGAMMTWHPAAILRAGEEAQSKRAELVAHLRAAAHYASVAE